MDPIQHDIKVIQGIAAVPSILDVVCRTTGMGFAAVARVTEDRWIACTVKDDINFGLKAGGELTLDTTICNEIRARREPVIIDHVAKDLVYRDHHTPRMYGFQSYISMPIMLPDGRFFGTLCAIDPKPARLDTPEVTEMFRLFAELIAFHIEGAEKLAVSESKLLEAREASELREQFIAVLGHDLRNPLGAISTATAVLRQMPLDERGKKLIGMMEGSVARMSGLIEDVMDFARGRLGGGLSLERDAHVPLEAVLEQVISEARSLHPDRVIETAVEIEGDIPGDRRRIAQLFMNLLGNALTHGRADRPVKVSAVRRDGRFELAVANASEPIPAEALGRLFQPFSRGREENYTQGLGLGLYIASEIARAHGGELAVSSTPEETRFTFSMAAN